MLFPERLRELRELSGKRQRELAAAIGVDVPMYSRYEHGERRPKREQVVKLAKLLGCSEADLVGRWLAFAALGEIGHDRMAVEALGFLKAHLGVADEAQAEKPQLAEQPVEQPVEPRVEVEAPRPAAVRLTPAPLALERDLALPAAGSTTPLLYCGDEVALLSRIDNESLHCIIATAPALDGEQSLATVLASTQEFFRILSSQGSVWLHLPHGARATTLGWQLAVAMEREQGWHMVHDIVWDKKNSDTPQPMGIASRHDLILHFVKDEHATWFDSDVYKKLFNELIVTNKRGAKTGQGYRQKIKSAAHMTPEEKEAASLALERALQQLNAGEIADFRLFVRESAIPMRDNTPQGRGVNEAGFYLLATLAMAPGDVWRQAPHEGTGMTAEIARLIVEASCVPAGRVLVTRCAQGEALAAAADRRPTVGLDADASAIEALKKHYTPKPEAPRELSLF